MQKSDGWDLVKEITGVSHDTVTKMKNIVIAAKENPKKYQKLTDKQYDFSKIKSNDMKKQIRNTIHWMLYNEKNCVVHHELFYQIAARNMIELIKDMAYCAQHSKSIVSRHEALENLGMMKAWKYLKIIQDALDDPNHDIRETAQWAMDRYARYKDNPEWSALNIV